MILISYLLFLFQRPCDGLSFKNPLITTSQALLKHKAQGYHPECPERLSGCLDVLKKMEDSSQIKILDLNSETEIKPEENNLALDIVKKVHCHKYVERVRILSSRGAQKLSLSDEDTYINRFSFNQSIISQLAWLKGVDHVLNSRSMAFSVSRPPGHHATFDSSMGFCIFNFAVGAAHYAIEHYNLSRVGILDFDVHYGNGVADLVKSNNKIRYTSLHELNIFPLGRGGEEETGDFGNILNIPVKYGAKFDLYEKLLREKAIPFIKEFNPELVIIWFVYSLFHEL